MSAIPELNRDAVLVALVVEDATTPTRILVRHEFGQATVIIEQRHLYGPEPGEFREVAAFNLAGGQPAALANALLLVPTKAAMSR